MKEDSSGGDRRKESEALLKCESKGVCALWVAEVQQDDGPDEDVRDSFMLGRDVKTVRRALHVRANSYKKHRNGN